MCGVPYSVRRISAEYRGVLVVCAARLADGSGPDTGDGQAAPAIRPTPVTAAMSGSRPVPSRNKHILNQRKNKVVIGNSRRSGRRGNYILIIILSIVTVHRD